MSETNGLWSVEFYNNSGSIGTGVVVINNGRILGGDSFFMYYGNLTQENTTVRADLEVSKYSNILPSQSIFGSIDYFHLKLSGSLDSNNLSLEGYMTENPQQKIHIRATHKVN